MTRTSATYGSASVPDRLLEYLDRHGIPATEAQPLAPDASTRRYFRIRWGDGTAVVAAYANPREPAMERFLQMTGFLAREHLPVPALYDVDAPAGIVVQEDLGDHTLASIVPGMDCRTAEAYLSEAVDLIARLQAATYRAVLGRCPAADRYLDKARLEWELGFFVDNYFGRLCAKGLGDGAEAAVGLELHDLAEAVAHRPRALCHRDFHGGNLLIDAHGRLRIIDYQDSLLGPVSYDLTCLLLDRRSRPLQLSDLARRVSALVAARQSYGLYCMAPDELMQEFLLVAVQRGLQATAVFAQQVCLRNRPEYAHRIEPAVRTVVQAAALLDRFPSLCRSLLDSLRTLPECVACTASAQPPADVPAS